MNEQQLAKARRRAPAELDFDALVERHRKRNGAMIEEWRREHPGTDSAILEIVVPATGQMRRRLRRYEEFAAAARNTPEVLVIRSASSFAFVDLKTITVDVAAACAGAAISAVQLLEARDALTSPP